MRKGICLLWAVMLLCTCLPAAAAVQHPGGNTVYNGMLSYSARVVVRETMETKKAAVADAAEMSAAEYAAYVRAALPSNVLTRPAYETEAARLGQIYAEDEDEEYAEKVLYALILTAQHYEEISDTVSKGKSSGMAN